MLRQQVNRGNRLNLYTADSETDPFLKGRAPEPFAWGWFDGTRFRNSWGANSTREFIQALYELEPGLVYIHNGGKFDIFFLLPHIDTTRPMLIIHGRVVQCWIKCRKGFHKLRDSLKILPFALEQYQKTKIDYKKLEAAVREQHKTEIVNYLGDDCRFLFDLVSNYIDKFGPAITIGTTALKELRKFHNCGDWLTASQDATFRTTYFFGGRVERYKTGVFEGNWKVFDVNSMYPFVMSNFYHPIHHPEQPTDEITPNTYFVTATGYSNGAFPVRDKQRVMFPKKHGTFKVTIHEWNAAKELGLFECDKIVECQNFKYSRCFVDYIMHYYNLRSPWKHHLEECKECAVKRYCEPGMKMRIDDIFFKYLLNNSYGKFAINPDNFREYILTPDTHDMRFRGFSIDEIIEPFNMILWSKPSEEAKFNNIATGASITGGARSVLMRGLYNAVNPMYCDTDCIICEDLPGVSIDAAKLGSWACEKTGNVLAIAGRKMYALFQDQKCVKYASKGVRIEPADIVRVANGATVTYEREAPTYRLDGTVDWLVRRVRTI